MDTLLPQPLSPHRQRKHNLMIQSILDTAREIMREQGVAALSMQELARRLDMRASSLYNYFPSKMAIYDALFQLGFRLYQEHLEKAWQEGQTWQKFVRLNFEGYFTFALENPDLYQLCFERPVPGFVPSEKSLKISVSTLEKYYERAAEYKNTIDTSLSAQQMVDLLIAMMHGITAMHLSNEPRLPLGQGRFGSLIPAVMEVLEKAWSKH